MPIYIFDICSLKNNINIDLILDFFHIRRNIRDHLPFVIFTLSIIDHYDNRYLMVMITSVNGRLKDDKRKNQKSTSQLIYPTMHNLVIASISCLYQTS